MFKDDIAAEKLRRIKWPEPKREFSAPMLVVREGTLVVKQKV